MDIGTKIIIWPPTFMVRSCTVLPLGVRTDIIFDVLASDVIGPTIVPTDAKSKLIAAALRCFFIL
jgi:hypothetical protein